DLRDPVHPVVADAAHVGVVRRRDERLVERAAREDGHVLVEHPAEIVEAPGPNQAERLHALRGCHVVQHAELVRLAEGGGPPLRDGRSLLHDAVVRPGGPALQARHASVSANAATAARTPSSSPARSSPLSASRVESTGTFRAGSSTTSAESAESTSLSAASPFAPRPG